MTTSCIELTLIAAASRTVEALRTAGLKAVVAESCTAGLVCAVLSQGEGATDAFAGGFVVYTKPQKHLALGVERDLLERRGAVNAEVAAAMLQGALAQSDAEIAVSVTGVLGPSEDEDGNPVGLVYIGSCGRGAAPVIEKRQLPKAPSDDLRRKAVLLALEAVRDRIPDGKTRMSK